jgi:hypothetical protein
VFADTGMLGSALGEMLVDLVFLFIPIRTNLDRPCVDNTGVLNLLLEDSEDEQLSVV